MFGPSFAVATLNACTVLLTGFPISSCGVHPNAHANCENSSAALRLRSLKYIAPWRVRRSRIRPEEEAVLAAVTSSSIVKSVLLGETASGNGVFGGYGAVRFTDAEYRVGVNLKIEFSSEPYFVIVLPLCGGIGEISVLAIFSGRLILKKL